MQRPEKPRFRALFVTLAALFLAYYLALAISDPGYPLSFSLIWVFLSLASLSCAFFGNGIVALLRKTALRPGVPRRVTGTLSVIFMAISIAFLILILIPRKSVPDAIETQGVSQDTRPTPQYLIILGGGIRRDGSVSTVLRARLDYAASLWRENPAMLLVVTGGKLRENPWPEAEEMSRYLAARYGIPTASVVVEPKARNTIENFRFSAEAIRRDARMREANRAASGATPRVAVLTSDFHMNRALFLARRAGLTPITAYRSPTPPLQTTSAVLREVLAYWKLSLNLALNRVPATR